MAIVTKPASIVRAISQTGLKMQWTETEQGFREARSGQNQKLQKTSVKICFVSCYIHFWLDAT